MKKGGHKIFRDRQKLQEMFSLRQQGWSLTQLGVKFGVDHTSILYLCHKYKVLPGIKVERKIPTFERKCLKCGKPVNAIANKFCSQKCYSQFCASKNEVLNEEIVEGEKINSGKDYMDYVREENRKKAERFRKLKIVLGLS